MRALRAVRRALRDAPAYQVVVQGGMLVVLAIAFVTSYESGREGAKALGYPGSGAALPLVCDIVAGLATIVHGRVRTDPAMRRTTAWFVIVPMVLSWGANAVDHVERATAGGDWQGWAQVAWILGVVVAAGICPVAVAALLHLSTKLAEFERRHTVTAPGRRPPKARRRKVTTAAKSPAVVSVDAPVDALAERRERDRVRKADWRAKQREAASGD